jgi:hypothetical protein
MVESAFFSPFMIPIVAIVGGISVAIVNSIGRARVRELEIRERIAMIERGMVPPPEVDPNGFERRMHAIDRMQTGRSSPKFRSGGVMVMSVGFGLMMMLWSLGAEPEGMGVGGFLVIIGLGLFVNSLFGSHPYAPPPPPPPPSQSQS